MENICDLPFEILQNIFVNLDLKSLSEVGKTCKKFYTLTSSQDKAFWKRMIKIVLNKYSQYLGFWAADNPSTGGMVVIKFDNKEIAINCYYVLPKVNIKSKPTLLCLWRVDLEAKRIHYPFRKELYLSLNPVENNRFIIKESIGLDDLSTVITGREWILSQLEGDSEMVYDDFNNYEYISPQFFQFVHLSKKRHDNFARMLRTGIAYDKLDLNEKGYAECNTEIPEALIKPGTFIGTYSVHGSEIIKLHYEKSNSLFTAIGTKISGDDNVPSGQKTFKAKLEFSVGYLNIENEMNLTSPVYTKFDNSTPRPIGMKFNINKEFLDKFNDNVSTELPETCFLRFRGVGQVAGSSFSNPRYISGEWIIFDNDNFAFMWPELRHLSLYKRLQITVD
ncbi:DgyrCDS13716 [Dimorphilus gyrociliatus]|uniref:DgyrCDS13716 n=1 Tax=Dimorphilus gyrociliatus TaxID=2664684 RepID=A0A7I8WBJ5_9ANNE|nr:DgyrCDS13716 [Dimorphilus gyrociliatus]